MTAKEMHIKFGLGFQKLGANVRRKLFDPQIDMILNQEYGNYILDHIKPKPHGFSFEADEEGTDALRPLIVRDYSIIPYITKSTSKLKVYSASLPINYGYLLNEKASLSCTLSTASDKTVLVAPFTIPQSTKSTTPFYATFLIKSRTGSTDTNLVDFSTLNNWTGVSNKADKFSFEYLIKELLSTPGYSLYYQSYAGKQYPNQFIMVYEGTGTPTSIVLSVDGTETVINFQSITRQVTLGGSNYESTPREVKATAVDQLITTPFYKPSKTEPLSILYGNQIDLFVHPSTIVSSLQITYIKQPEKIDVSLSRNCTLDDIYCDKIIGRAVEFASGTIGSQDLYAFKTRDNAPNKPQ